MSCIKTLYVNSQQDLALVKEYSLIQELVFTADHHRLDLSDVSIDAQIHQVQINGSNIDILNFANKTVTKLVINGTRCSFVNVRLDNLVELEAVHKIVVEKSVFPKLRSATLTFDDAISKPFESVRNLALVEDRPWVLENGQVKEEFEPCALPDMQSMTKLKSLDVKCKELVEKPFAKLRSLDKLKALTVDCDNLKSLESCRRNLTSLSVTTKCQLNINELKGNTSIMNLTLDVPSVNDLSVLDTMTALANLELPSDLQAEYIGARYQRVNGIITKKLQDHIAWNRLQQESDRQKDFNDFVKGAIDIGLVLFLAVMILIIAIVCRIVIFTKPI